MRASLFVHSGALAVTACALATACGGGASSRTEPVKIRGNSLVLIDEASTRVVADVRVGRDPARVTFGRGAFWVVSPDARTVVRVDADKKTAARLHVGEEPYDVAIGAGALWVPDHDAQRLLRFDLVTHTLRQTRDLGVPAISVGFGFGSVWLVVADGRLLRIDPRTQRVEASMSDVTTTMEGSEPKLAFTRGSIWISSPAESTVARVNPVRGTVRKQTLIGATGISAGAGAVWVADNVDAIWQYRQGGRRRVRVGIQPQDVVATAKGIWVANYGDETVVRVDPVSRHVTARIRLHRHPVAISAGSGIVAVATIGLPA